MHNNQIGISFLDNYESLTQAIEKNFGVSKSHIKKFKKCSKLLRKKVLPKMTFWLPIDLINVNMINPLFLGETSPKVITESDDFIILSKPVKIHCHPLAYSETDNILSFIRSHFSKSVLNVNVDNYDRGLLYRLDYETSGLIIYVKNSILHKRLRENFKAHVVKKEYMAIVEGRVLEEQHLCHQVYYSGRKNSVGKIALDENENSFILHSRLIPVDYNPSKDVSLVKMELNEGHRHQLRIQLSAIGHCILGDPLYGKTEAERMFLHCYRYTLNIDENNYIFIDKNLELFGHFFNLNGQF